MTTSTINPALVDVDPVDNIQVRPEDPPGFDGLVEMPSEDDMLMRGGTRFPESLLIDESEWRYIIEEHNFLGTWAKDYSDRFTHQGRSHECVCHAACQAFLTAWNLQLGTRHSIWPSPLSLYTRITGGRQWGGSMVLDSLEELVDVGVLPEHDGPGGDNAQFNKFKHTIHQTSGRSESHWATKGWIRERDFPNGWETTANLLRVDEWYTIPNREAHASALLHGWTVVNGRRGHSIPHMALVVDGNRILSEYKDSYNVFRYDSESLWGGGYCIRSVKSPNIKNVLGEVLK